METGKVEYMYTADRLSFATTIQQPTGKLAVKRYSELFQIPTCQRICEHKEGQKL